jgi:plastocyanin
MKTKIFGLAVVVCFFLISILCACGNTFMTTVTNTVYYPPVTGTPFATSTNTQVTLINQYLIPCNAQGFQPRSVSVAHGTTVVWQNCEEADYVIIADNGLFYGSLPSGSRFAYTFNVPGTYVYRINLYPELNGVITVT